MPLFFGGENRLWHSAGVEVNERCLCGAARQSFQAEINSPLKRPSQIPSNILLSKTDELDINQCHSICRGANCVSSPQKLLIHPHKLLIESYYVSS